MRMPCSRQIISKLHAASYWRSLLLYPAAGLQIELPEQVSANRALDSSIHELVEEVTAFGRAVPVGCSHAPCSSALAEACCQDSSEPFALQSDSGAILSID